MRVRNLQTLAESSRRSTDAIEASEPDVPWRAISGFRTILVHDDPAIEVDAVWLVMDRELPQLRAALGRMEKRARWWYEGRVGQRVHQE